MSAAMDASAPFPGPALGPGVAKARERDLDQDAAPPITRGGTSRKRQIERRIQADPALPVRKKGDLMLIASYVDPDTCRIGSYSYYSYFAGEWGCHRRTVIRRFRYFEDVGYIGITRRWTIEARAGEPNTKEKRNRANEFLLLDGTGKALELEGEFEDEREGEREEPSPPEQAPPTPPAAGAAPAAPAPLPPPLSEAAHELLAELARHPLLFPLATPDFAARYNARAREHSKTFAQALKTIRDVATKCVGQPPDVLQSRLFSFLDIAKPVADRVAVVGSLAACDTIQELDLEALATAILQIHGETPGRSLARTIGLIFRAAKDALASLDKRAKRKAFLNAFREGLGVAPPAPASTEADVPARQVIYSGRSP